MPRRVLPSDPTVNETLATNLWARALVYSAARMDLSLKSAALVVVEPFQEPVPPGRAVVNFACARLPAVLESSAPAMAYGRFSIFACDPVETFRLGRSDRRCPFQALAERTAGYPATAAPQADLPFAGGWIGYFTYESGLGTERLVPTTQWPAGLPLAHFHLYDAAAVFDHQSGTWLLVAVDWPKPLASRRPTVAMRLALLRDRLLLKPVLGTEERGEDPVVSPPEPNLSAAQYRAAVEQAKRYIEAGDIYQVNVTQRYTARTQASPVALYRRLRQVSPSSHAAFLPWGRHAVLSSSPELFLELRGGQVVTRPIKGTRPRGSNAASDAAQRRTLAESEKDRAELAMIIDLLRNDLGRVCSYGSIRVERAWEIEAHPTVFHQVATIRGALEPGRNWMHLLLAAFPGGSITGAPKIRAMQIIDELEPTARGVYCGSIGIIGLDGSLSLNVAIRTMVQADGLVHIHTGGAIVADSTADEEYEECLAKAAGMLRAVGCSAPRTDEAPVEVTSP